MDASLKSIAIILLASRLAAGEWTFSLRINSTRCDGGSCDGLFVGVCLRQPGTSREDGHSCFLFIAVSDANTLLDRELTSADEVDPNLMPIGGPYVKPIIPYKGGVQLYLVMLTERDIPPFNTEGEMVDEMFVDVNREPGAGECSTVEAVGLRGRVDATISFTVDCYTGFSGVNCSCTGDMMCESTGATSSSLCDGGTNPPTPSTTTPPPTSPSDQSPTTTASGPPITTEPTASSTEPPATTTTTTEPTASSTEPATTTTTTNSTEPTASGTTTEPTASGTTTEPTTTGSNSSGPPTAVSSGLNSTEETGNALLVPVSAAGGGLVLLLMVLILLITLCVVCRRRRYKKSYRLDLSNLMGEPQKLTPTIPPSEVVDDGVTYTAVVHDNSAGYHNTGHGEVFGGEKVDLSQHGSGLVYAQLDHDSNGAPPTEEGLQYAQLDHDRPTYSTFKKRGSLKRKPPPPEAPIQYVTIKKEQPHKYVNVGTPLRAKPRKNLPRGELNVYSTVPPDIRKAPSNQ